MYYCPSCGAIWAIGGAWKLGKRAEGEGLRGLGGLRVEGCGPRAEGGEHRAFSSDATGQRPASLYKSLDRHGDTAWSPYLQSSCTVLFKKSPEPQSTPKFVLCLLVAGAALAASGT